MSQSQFVKKHLINAQIQNRVDYIFFKGTDEYEEIVNTFKEANRRCARYSMKINVFAGTFVLKSSAGKVLLALRFTRQELNNLLGVI
mgnify:FL=1